MHSLTLRDGVVFFGILVLVAVLSAVREERNGGVNQ